jgi:hypothetical protein
VPQTTKMTIFIKKFHSDLLVKTDPFLILKKHANSIQFLLLFKIFNCLGCATVLGNGSKPT